MAATSHSSSAALVPLPVLADVQQRRSVTTDAARGDGGITDAYGRGIGYLRLSLTKGCAMRCTYCRPAKLENPVGESRLSVDEIENLVRHLAERHGLRKVRLTGGDPTSRPELTEIIGRIAAVPGVDDLAMTTNGLTLPKRAAEYAAAGLKRVNISLDTLDRRRFARLTGVDGLARVLEGIDAALEAGLRPIKLNTVVVRDQNERDLISLVRFAADKGLETRFIELMPMGPLAARWDERYVSEPWMQRELKPAITSWRPMPQGRDAARRYGVTLTDGRRTTIGFITPMSCNFCEGCNRIRVAADGTFYPCLMDRPAGSLRSALGADFDPDRLDGLLAAGLARKAPEHPHDGFAVMTHIGG